MKEREKFEVADQKQKILGRDGYQCQHCGEPARFLAHRIAQTKANIAKYTEFIVHHPKNLVAVCERPDCNDKFNVGNNPITADNLVRDIIYDSIDKAEDIEWLKWALRWVLE